MLQTISSAAEKQNITLRPLQSEDVDHLMTWVNNSLVTGKFAHFQQLTREDEAAYVRRMLSSPSDRVFVIELNNQYIGQAGLHLIDWHHRTARISLIIGNMNKWGHGYAQAALHELGRLAFGEYNLHKLWLTVFEENAKARHLYEKCGFIMEGVLRDEYFVNGAYHAMVRMALLADDFYHNINKCSGTTSIPLEGDA